MIATGNHGDFDSLRDAPRPYPALASALRAIDNRPYPTLASALRAIDNRPYRRVHLRRWDGRLIIAPPGCRRERIDPFRGSGCVMRNA